MVEPLSIVLPVVKRLLQLTSIVVFVLLILLGAESGSYGITAFNYLLVAVISYLALEAISPIPTQIWYVYEGGIVILGLIMFIETFLKRQNDRGTTHVVTGGSGSKDGVKDENVENDE